METDLGLWGQIKQRRVTQFLLAYLASGWMVLAVVDQVVDREVLPGVVYRVSLTLYVFGIAGAVILGWYHGEKGQQRATFVETVLLCMVGLLAAGASGQIVRNYVREVSVASALETSRMDLRRLAVMYLDDASRDGSLAAVADGLTEELIGALTQVAELDVVSRNGSESVRGLGLAPDSVAAIFDAGTLIDGSVEQVGQDLHVVVRVVDGQSGTPITRDQYVWPMDQLATAAQDLAQQVSRSLRVVLGQEIHIREARAGAPSTAAWLQLARADKALKDGVTALGRGDAEAAAAYLALADEESARARMASARWVDPINLRGRAAYEGHALATTMEELVGSLESAIAFADESLALEPNNAAALELRGTARYRLWLLQQDDEATLDAMLEAARADLERAESLDRRVAANVNSVLSHLYYQVDDWQEAVLSARKAYQQDAFLSAADGVLRRLYQASYDLGQYEEARDWCLEGGRRFPDNYRFVQCRIYVLTMERALPDVDEAWALYDEFVKLVPASQARLLSALTRTFVGGVIGRAGLADSANAVLVGARVDRDVDPDGEQVSMEAAMRSVFGDVDGAVERLQRYMIQNPGHFPGEHWWWQNLEGDAAFERLQSVR